MGEQPLPSNRITLSNAVGSTFLGTAAVQISTFVVLATAGMALPVDEFARLSIIVATAMFSTAIIELGLGITATRMFRITGDESYLSSAVFVQVCAVAAGAAVGAVFWLAYGQVEIGLGLGLGAVLNLWNGSRVIDQALQDYKSFARVSLAFAAIRAVAGLTATFATKDALAIGVAIFAVPILAIFVSRSYRAIAVSFSTKERKLRELVGYVYLNSVMFLALSYLPQFVLAGRDQKLDVATYGLVLTFTAPVSLFIYSLRSALLPRFTSAGDHLEKKLWSFRALAMLAGLWVLSVVAAALVGQVLGYLYHARYPQMALAFLIFFAAVSATGLVGIYSLSIHTLGIPQLSMWITLLRLLALIVCLNAFGQGLLSIVTISATLLVAGEIVHVGALAWVRHRVGRASQKD
jgi:O-antigen/teichoic acid export membrane protein